MNMKKLFSFLFSLFSNNRFLFVNNQRSKVKGQSGFTLIEMLIYMVLLMVVGGLMGGVFMSVIRISNHQTSDNEISSQTNFVMAKIGQLVKQASNVEIISGISTSTLKLRMPVSASDPTCISLEDGVIKLAQGHAGQPDESACSTTTMDLTTSKIIADNLAFRKITFYPGHDEVIVDMQLSFNSDNPQSQVSRALHFAFSRVSAATFDDNLVPGSTGSYDIGTTSNIWRSINNLIYFSGDNTGIGITNPASKFQVSEGDAYVSTQGNGLILRDTSGSGCHRLTVSSGGALTATAITCP